MCLRRWYVCKYIIWCIYIVQLPGGVKLVDLVSGCQQVVICGLPVGEAGGKVIHHRLLEYHKFNVY